MISATKKKTALEKGDGERGRRKFREEMMKGKASEFFWPIKLAGPGHRT